MQLTQINQNIKNENNFSQSEDFDLLLELYIARISFLSFNEKKILKKNLDSSCSLVLLSIEEIKKIINRDLSNKVVWNAKENFRMAQVALHFCNQLGVKILLHSDKDYPEQLRQIADPPYLLFYKGDVSLLSKKTVSVVGTRRLTQNGKIAAKEFAYNAALNGEVVVSGLAKGADEYAHRGVVDAYFDCFEKGLDTRNLGKTIAVLPSSIDEIVPLSNKKLAGQILQTGGLIISEYEPRMTIANWHFVKRNRIIAGLSFATVVVEAPAGSGALITVDFALENGRDVYFHKVCFSDNAKQIASIVKNQLETDFNNGKVSKYKKENTVEKYLEAGAPIIENYEDYCAACNEVPGQRHIRQMQGTLFDI